MPPWNRKKKVGGAQKERISRMDPAMTIFREAAGSSLFEGPISVSFSHPFTCSFMPHLVSPSSFFFSTLPFSTSEGTATLFSTTVKALIREWGSIRETSYLPDFIRVLLDQWLHFAKIFFLFIFSKNYYNVTFLLDLIDTKSNSEDFN